MVINTTQNFTLNSKLLRRMRNFANKKATRKTNVQNLSLYSSILLTCKTFGQICATFFAVPQAHIHISWYTQSQIMITLITLYLRAPILHLWVPPPVLQKVALHLICYETNRCFDRRNNRRIDRCINHCVLQTKMCISLIWCNSCNHVDISVTHHIWASGNHSTFCPFNV